MTETLHASSSQRNTLSDKQKVPVALAGKPKKRISQEVRFFCMKEHLNPQDAFPITQGLLV